MNIVFIIPTGIGAEIGGHSGDGTPAAKLIASLCNKLIVHPNVVNASDINEIAENMMYVEGSILDKFLEGTIGLKEVYNNKILLATNKPLLPEIINAVSAARVTIGADIEIVEFNKPLRMVAKLDNCGKATGDIYNLEDAIRQVSKYTFDALVVHSPIETNKDDVHKYLSTDGGTNVWGGVEAKLSKAMSESLGRPVIHAPIENSKEFQQFADVVVDPRKAAEMVSVCYVHCCLKGAHTTPKLSTDSNDWWNTDIDFMITPANVFGRPHIACVKAGIPVIAVKENKTILDDKMPDSFIVVDNYLEAAGVISAQKAGVSISSVRRPLLKTKIFRGEE